MAVSTGIVITAGAFGMADHILNEKWEPIKALRLLVGTVAAAYVSAGLDKVLDGWGTGLAVLLLVGAILTNGPRIVNKMFPT